MTSRKPAATRKETWSGIQVQNRQKRVELSLEAVSRFCRQLLSRLGKTRCALSVVFVGARRMRLLNRDYRGLDSCTDVLSFSYGQVIAEEVPFLGEIVISPEVACSNARRYGVPAGREIEKLLAHGLLHLLGYDHETDRGEMNRMQVRLLRSLKSEKTPKNLRHSRVPLRVKTDGSADH